MAQRHKTTTGKRRSARQRKPRLLSLCSGVGGIDLSWEMAGGEIAGQCEIDGFCQQVLAKHWPDVRRVSDIRSVWGDSFNGPIDLIAGGIPCQPWSVAGLRRGAADQRHLWPEMLRIIDIYQPAFVLIENVSGFIGLALDGVLADLDASGYEAGALVLPAAAVGAPHRRERVFIVGHTRHTQRAGRDAPQTGSARGAGAGEQPRHESASSGGDVDRAAGTDVAREGHLQWAATECGCEDVAHATSGSRCGATQRSCGLTLAGDPSTTGDVVNASSAGHQERNVSRVAGDAGYPTGRSAASGRARQAKSTVGREFDGLSRRLDRDQRDDSEDAYPYQPWPAGPGEPQHEWEAPRVTSAHIPNRAARLKALGNAVCPQQIYPILRAIIEQWRIEQAALNDQTNE